MMDEFYLFFIAREFNNFVNQMSIVRAILASIFILYVWIWLINTAFGK
jgi:hypothetical protein